MIESAQIAQTSNSVNADVLLTMAKCSLPQVSKMIIFLSTDLMLSDELPYILILHAKLHRILYGSTGISAGIDLSFYFVKKQNGIEAARKVADRMEYDWKDLDCQTCTCQPS